MKKFYEKRLFLSTLIVLFSGVMAADVFLDAVNAEPIPPSISDMLREVAREDAQEEVLEAVEEAGKKLEAGDLYAAKMQIMELKSTIELTSADYRILDPVERKVNEELADDREKIVEQIEKELEEKELLSEYRKQKQVETELKKRSAVSLVEKARTELYQRNNPQDAVELAREAYALDPDNKEAEKLILQAEVELSETAAELTQEADLLSRQARIRVESLKQEYAALKRRAMQHQEKSEFEQARDVWANARTYVNVLSVYDDMGDEVELVESQYEYAKEQAEKIRREEEEQLAQRREEEATRRLEEEMRAKEEMDAEREAEMLDDAWNYVRRGRYREAQRIVDEMLLMDSTNEGALVLYDIITDQEHDDAMRREVQRREREDLRLFRNAYERSTARSDEITYPDRDLWQRIIQRDPVEYPTEIVERPEKELALEEELKQSVGLDFERHRDLTEVVDYISDITGVEIMVNSRAFDDSERPPRIRARFQASIENALDHIVREGSTSGNPLAWAIDGDIVRIDSPGNLMDYQLRIYDVRDVLVSVADTMAEGPLWGQEPISPPDSWVTIEERDIMRLQRRIEPSPSMSRRARMLDEMITTVITPGQWRERRPPEAVEAEDADGDWDDWGQAFGADNEETQHKGPYLHFREENPGDFIIIHTPEKHEEIEKLLKALRESINIQVHVETRFVEVKDNFLRELGVDWTEIDLTPEFLDGDSGISLSGDIGTGIPVLRDQTQNYGAEFNFGIFEGVEMEAFLKAVQKSENSRVTHTPSVTLMNSQRGQLYVRTTRRYVVDYEVDDGNITPVFDEYSDGVMLDIRPIVSADRRYVYLELKPNIDKVIDVDLVPIQLVVEREVVGPDGEVEERQELHEVNTEQPNILVQEFFNTVGVPDQGLLVVGGLGESEEREIETGVPFLSKVPIMKRLFGSEAKSSNNSTLLILVRPRIIMFHEEEELAF